MKRTANEPWAWLANPWRPRCVVCAIEPGQPVCEACERDFFSADVAPCCRCALRVATLGSMYGACLANTPHFYETTALADCRAPVDGMVTALKFGSRLDLARCIARLAARREPASAPADLVLAVPLSFERESKRGYNQAREIARRYAKLTGAPLSERVLLRVRHSPPQQTLARDARRKNVRGAFALHRAVAGLRVIVVDDVMTTGSTLDEIARVLKDAGATWVVNRVVAGTP